MAKHSELIYSRLILATDGYSHSEKQTDMMASEITKMTYRHVERHPTKAKFTSYTLKRFVFYLYREFCYIHIKVQKKTLRREKYYNEQF
jgi:hypothetical protein